MVRAPCCEKMGVKKGPWTKEEDEILVSFIQSYGHGNWRALPKLAGLSRCGKSCRLRWTNYLRPDIKRGNFTKEEEDMIIALHQMLGNRWSAIAARLPGRTDNEIKNVWHTHLKKRAYRDSSDRATKNAMENDAVNATKCLHSEEGCSEFDGFPEIEESFWVDALCMNRADADNYYNNDEFDDVSFWYDVFVEKGDCL